MKDVAIHPLTQISTESLRSLIQGYTSTERFIVAKIENEQRVSINLELVQLEQPYRKQWPPDAAMEEHYRSIIEQGFSLSITYQQKCIGLAIAEKRDWNRSLWVWEFHILKDFQGQGYGRKLMEALAQLATQVGCRVMVCETQNTNLPAIRFYRKLGFEVGAVDLSYYSNQDLSDFEVAIFMKRYLQP